MFFSSFVSPRLTKTLAMGMKLSRAPDLAKACRACTLPELIRLHSSFRIQLISMSLLTVLMEILIPRIFFCPAMTSR